VGFDELAESLAAAFRQSLDAELEPGGLTEGESREIDALHRAPALA
jgi:hypothetical protein